MSFELVGFYVAVLEMGLSCARCTFIQLGRLCSAFYSRGVAGILFIAISYIIINSYLSVRLAIGYGSLTKQHHTKGTSSSSM